jgi:hypothetical protein
MRCDGRRGERDTTKITPLTSKNRGGIFYCKRQPFRRKRISKPYRKLLTFPIYFFFFFYQKKMEIKPESKSGFSSSFCVQNIIRSLMTRNKKPAMALMPLIALFASIMRAKCH